MNQKKEEKVLPQIIKQSATFKLKVPANVEEKIRYLIRKFPHTEWSGVLFYTHTGTFEDNNLQIVCKDIYPMDLGSSGWTEFIMDETVAGYIADNMELFDCELGLVHSHHTMGAFFSGQDVATLRSEGNERNCFVSLIVDTKGTYQAAITRKLQTKHEVTVKSLGKSYPFFGEGDVSVEDGTQPEITKVVDKETIEYFMLDVEREVVDNPLSWLDTRFEEIESKKVADLNKFKTSIPEYGSDNNYDFPKKVKQLSLFDKDEDDTWETFKGKGTKTDENKLHSLKDDELELEWYPSQKDVDHMISCILTCSLLVNPDYFDAKDWIENKMDRNYKRVFSNDFSFTQWVDFIIGYFVDDFAETNPNPDVVASQVAYALIQRFDELTSNNKAKNPYIEEYYKTLANYLI